MLRVSLVDYYLELWDIEMNAFMYEYTKTETFGSNLGGQGLSIDFSVLPDGDIYILTGHSLDIGCV